MDQVLGKLFGSPARVKIMRLFLFNPETFFGNADIKARSHVSSPIVAREVACLNKVGLINKKIRAKRIYIKKGKKRVVKTKKVAGWVLNRGFLYLGALQSFLLGSSSFKHEVISKRFNRAGRIKLLIISGVFIKNEDSRVDLLLVGDNLKRPFINKTLKALESEVGKELRCAVMETNDFIYRFGVYDKFVRDIVDYPHENLIDKLGLRFLR